MARHGYQPQGRRQMRDRPGGGFVFGGHPAVVYALMQLTSLGEKYRKLRHELSRHGIELY